MIDNKDYIERQYKLIVSHYKCARTEDEQWELRKQMADLELLAVQLGYGFEYVNDVLEKIKDEIRPAEESPN